MQFLEKNMKNLILLTLFLFITSCSKGNYSQQKTFDLSNGKTIKVLLKEKDLEREEKVFLVEYQTNEKNIRDEIIEKEVLEIWNNVKKEAESLNLDEALIKYEFLIGKTKEDKKVYEGVLFNAEKIENGEWKITKVN